MITIKGLLENGRHSFKDLKLGTVHFSIVPLCFTIKHIIWKWYKIYKIKEIAKKNTTIHKNK